MSYFHRQQSDPDHIDPIEAARQPVPAPPDELCPLPDGRRDLFPYEVQHHIERGNTQFDLVASEASEKVQPLIRERRGNVKLAEHQQAEIDKKTTTRDRSQATAEHVSQILTPYVRTISHRVTEFKYWLFAVCLGGADAFGLSLVLILLGATTLEARLVAIGYGAAIIVSGYLGRDLRRQYLWRELVPLDDTMVPADQLRRQIYSATDRGWDFLRWVAAVAASFVVVAGIGILAVRSVLDGFGLGMGFAAINLAVAAMSWVNAWANTDPASEIIHQYRRNADTDEHALQALPRTAIDKVEELTAEALFVTSTYENRAHAAFRQDIAAGFAMMATNPYINGYGTVGRHEVGSITPTRADAFDRLRADIAPNPAGTGAPVLTPTSAILAPPAVRPAHRWPSPAGRGQGPALNGAAK